MRASSWRLGCDIGGTVPHFLLLDEAFLLLERIARVTLEPFLATGGMTRDSLRAKRRAYGSY